MKDFGTRGYDLAFALDTAKIIILVDTVGRGEEPGTLYTIQPDLENREDEASGFGEHAPDAHAMDPMQVLRLAKRLEVVPGQIFLIGCEPATFGPENEGLMGLSPPVEAAVDRAVELIESMITRLRTGNEEGN